MASSSASSKDGSMINDATDAGAEATARLDRLLDDVGYAIRGLEADDPLAELAERVIGLVEGPTSVAVARRVASLEAMFGGGG